jgi:uncharacterized protein YfaS (alpha-2-macroglobulin family)
MKRLRIASLVAICLAAFVFLAADEPASPQDQWEKASKLNGEGNYNDAYKIYSELALGDGLDAEKTASSFSLAVDCLRRLNRRSEIDAFREKVVAAHPENVQVLRTAARSLWEGQHWGFMVAGEFERGHHRGGGQRVGSFERDRVRALQLMVQAMDHLAAADQDEKQMFWRHMEQYLMGYRGWSEAWRLQYLTDLSELPDYEENYYGWYRGGSDRGAPVDEEGNPIYYYRPKTWDEAKNDGERWRYALAMVTEYDNRNYEKSQLAQFCHQQFGVQTLQQYGNFFGRNWGMEEDSAGKAGDTGTWELHTLKDSETIAKLATGPKRFALPDEFNFIRLWKELGNDNQLAQIYLNRRQYGRSGELYEKLIRQHSREEVKQHLSETDWMWLPDDKKYYDHRWQQLRQIMGNFGQFEPIMLQPAGQPASVEFRFRNGKEVTFTAHAVKIKELLEDAKAYIKSNPSNDNWNWQQMDIGNVGHRLVNENQQKYVGEQVAEWKLDLEPRADHFDKRITVNTPLQKAGAYLLTAKMAGGNTCNVIIWLADTAIVHKPLSEQRQWYFVTDAVTGEPLEKMNVEFFGWRRDVDWGRNGRVNKVETFTKHFSEHTDADGQVILGQDRMPNSFQWVAIARDEAGRLAYLGWQGIWGATRHDSQYHAVRSFVMTDRPVYRPGQSAKIHFWVNTAKYDIDGESEFAGRKFTMEIRNPRGETVKEIPVTLDTYGGAGGEITFEEEPPLGVWSVQLWEGAKGHQGRGRGSFRVEEYRKPEYEVTIEAPAEPVALGETIEATVKASYYFGGPVQNAKVHYKVTRSEHDARWYPVMPWDWLYGGGYWWFAYDYTWYPGWSEWGCRRPYWPWWGWRPTPQPELVADAEAEIGADGTLKIKIDTALAKAIHGDRDHRYDITAEVRDASRRTIIGTGQVLVSRKPFKVYSWTNRGHYRVGDTVEASFQARRLDGKGVEAKGELRLMKVTYKDGQPVEDVVQTWNLPTDADGRATKKIDAAQAGQYRLSYTATDAKGHCIEGGYVFMIWGEGVTGSEFRYNALELTPEKTSYNPGETVALRINRNRAGGAVALFDRPSNGVYLPPKIIRLKGKSVAESIEVVQRDMPNFFIEAVTVADGEAHSVVRQIVVPPAKRILDMTVTTDKNTYKPGETGKVTVKLRDETGEPFVGAVVLTLYDKAVEYISGGTNVGDIKEIYWGWKRSHNPNQQTSLQKSSGNLVADARRDALNFLGVFGYSAADEPGPDGYEWDRSKLRTEGESLDRSRRSESGPMLAGAAKPPMPTASAAPMSVMDKAAEAEGAGGGGGGDGMAETTVRTQFADTALWRGDIVTDKDGTATIELTMPENLTTWKARAWAMGHGTRVGEASAEAITTKDLLVRLITPRFAVQKDEFTISAIVMNRLDNKKTVKVSLDLAGGTLELSDAEIGKNPMRELTGEIEVEAGGEARVDWVVKAVGEGNAAVTVKALTDEESDAMRLEFPVYVHGMLKTESFSGALRPEDNRKQFTINVPAERRPEQSRLEIRYSPTLAMAMVDALPYLLDYPYGCTEQTLNRFVPAVITQKALQRMGVSLEDVRGKISNLNAQEIGDDEQRSEDWGRTVGEPNPVWSQDEMNKIVKTGLERLYGMQNADGGWGWFSAYHQRSYPHTTAVVVDGLLTAKGNDVAVVPGVLQKGVDWLKRYQAEQVDRLQLWEKGERDYPAKEHADNLDALVYSIVTQAGVAGEDVDEMGRFLYRDRLKLSPYGLSMAGLGFDNVQAVEKRDMVIENLSQYLVEDDENQTAYLKIGASWYWWFWYADEIETQAAYLRLLCRTEPKGARASRLVKYLLNNRRHATYWKSTRDTAYVIEAFAEYLKASGEDKPDMAVIVSIDGKEHKRVKIDAENLFSFDNKLVLTGKEVTTGEHTITVAREGDGPVYFNAYLTNFTLEDPIAKAGLEIKVTRNVYKLVPVEKTIKAEGSRGQAVDQKVEKYDRVLIPDAFTESDEQPPRLESGEMIEVELVIESKNDYEYIVIEDYKAAGTEPVEVRSGRGDNAMGAYMELRDEKVAFFVRSLARGKHSLSYRLFAETPGRFSALPAQAEAMYAPELKANSNEQKLQISEEQ